ncbi:TetR/AcrR family transcriptional regulator [Mycobacterium sp. 236(2023)]|uniref:TetR/AcrR family transcriptional regulator n=1 Tax=Mycobacterium sp. 236(2023) TaxID=3038163 RepID=UPI00241592F8|nr:TetR/AcrR family transcriptional regulator [Mycobacterium sp. 236(2023)]MDG4666798.1 TetR/AcrR family transcriptional regulator [Mycobacterium sp. 236(2023)]
MAFDDRRERERAARRKLIIATARRVAEAEGWDAVTTRRLSAEIEYSQPVLYKHFSGMEQITDAIAVEAFGELAEAIRRARAGSGGAAGALSRVARAYLTFATANPAVYDAMFTRVTSLRFADTDTPPQLESAFTELRLAVDLVAGEQDSGSLTEVFWSALHGLVTLGRTGRLRQSHERERVKLLVAQFVGS